MSNIIITGGHSGIGLELTKKLLYEGHKLGLVMRSEQRKNELAELMDISEIDFFYGDLSIQSEVRKVAEDIKSKWQQIDILFNNAGMAIMKGDRRTSKQGNEYHLEINTLAPSLLTNELKPLLLNSADAKVVTTVTQGLNSLPLKTENIFDQGYSSGMNLYSQSKLAVMLLMNDLAKQDGWQGVKFLSVHPGNNKTNITQSKENMPAFIKLMVSLFFKSPNFGAQRLYNAAFNERMQSLNGVYLYNDKVLDLKYTLSSADKKLLMSAIQVKEL